MFWNITLFTIAYIIFGLLIYLKAKQAEISHKQPFSYYLTVLIPQCIFIVSILALFIISENNSIMPLIFGLFIYLIGILIRLKALNDFKIGYNLSEKRISNHLITNGIYQYSRHPLYLGTLLVYLGLTLTIFSKSGIILYFTFLLPLFLIRIVREEKEFANDKNYEQYKKNVYCLIPFIF